MTVFKTRYRANKALVSANKTLKYKILQHDGGYIVACGLLTL